MTCLVDGCDKTLGSRNRTGYCRVHIQQSAEMKAYVKQWKRDNPDRTKAARQRYEDSHREEIRARAREYQRTVQDKRSSKRRLEQYGITDEEWNAMLLAAGHACEICRRSGVVLCVDHDHTTNAVRGVLCHNCNMAIGFLKEDPTAARAAAGYLDRFKL